MSARNKLNQAYFNGALLVAALIGWQTGSWPIFGLALAAAVVVNVITGNIRPRR